MLQVNMASALYFWSLLPKAYSTSLVAHKKKLSSNIICSQKLPAGISQLFFFDFCGSDALI